MDNFGSLVFFSLIQLSLLVSSVESSRMRCFNCTYVEYTKKETWGGLEECQGEEFDVGKVPVVTCDGSCVTRSVWGDVVVTQRACHGKGDGPCRRIDRYPLGEDGYVSQVCCTGSRCNNAENDDAVSVRLSGATTLAVAQAIALSWLFGPPWL